MHKRGHGSGSRAKMTGSKGSGSRPGNKSYVPRIPFINPNFPFGRPTDQPGNPPWPSHMRPTPESFPFPGTKPGGSGGSGGSGGTGGGGPGGNLRETWPIFPGGREERDAIKRQLGIPEGGRRNDGRGLTPLPQGGKPKKRTRRK